MYFDRNFEEMDSPEQDYDDLKPSFDQLQHVGPAGGFVGINKDMRQYQNPMENFISQVDAISRHLMSQDNSVISETDIQKLLDTVSSIENIKYKNPTAYVLGYIASNKGRNITKKSASAAFYQIDSVRDESIREQDVIRYARYWLTLGD